MECIRHEILNNFQAANLYFFQSFRYNVTYEEVWETQPGKPSAWVTWRPSDHWKNLTGMVWTHINFIRTFQVTLLAGITWRGRGRRKTSERLSDTLRLLVASRQWHSLHGGIFLENFQKGGGGGVVYRPAWHWSKMLFFASVFRSGFRKFYLIYNTFFGTFKSASVTEHQHSWNLPELVITSPSVLFILGYAKRNILIRLSLKLYPILDDEDYSLHLFSDQKLKTVTI